MSPSRKSPDFAIDEEISAITTFRIELLKFYENLYSDDGSGFRDTSGWVCHFAKNHRDGISFDDIVTFVRKTLSRMNIGENDVSDDAVRNIAAGVYANYKFTLDDRMIAFVLKSKTEIVRRKPEKVGILRRMFRSIFGIFAKRDKNDGIIAVKR